MKLSEYIEKFGDKQVDVNKLSAFITEDKVFVPKQEEKFWYVGLSGEVDFYTYYPCTYPSLITNCQQVYRTRAEAEFASEKAIFLEFMRKEFLRNSDEIDWQDEYQKKYHLFYDHYDDCITYQCTAGHQTADIKTTNEKWLKQFVEEHLDDIKKYYFEVNDDE